MACLIAAMISELLLEIKNGMVHASVATKKYHIRAVFSLVFQVIHSYIRNQVVI